MVNITMLQKIFHFARSESLRPMRRWSTRRRFTGERRLVRNVRQMVSKIRILLSLVSGYDIVEMLKG